MTLLTNAYSVSIIIPVYNTKSTYLKECLDSVLNQTYTAWELIIVNDGSYKSDTLNTILSYTYDSRVKVINLKENKGAGEARNIGLLEAKGEYCTFWDADDFYDKTYLDEMISAIRKNDSDIVVCGFLLYGESLDGDCICKTQSMKNDGEGWLFKIPANPWIKVFKRQFLLEKGIKFQSLSSYNDGYFSMISLLSTKKIVFLHNKYLVKYRHKAIDNISSQRNPYNAWYVYKELLDRKSKERDFNDDIEREIKVAFLNGALEELRNSSSDDNSKKLYEKVRDSLKNYKFKDVKNQWKLHMFQTMKYDSLWFLHQGDFVYQLNMKSEQLKLELESLDKLILWGMGKRGIAFISWTQKNGIVIDDVYDQKLSSKKGEEFLNIREAELLNASSIVVSNSQIKKYILSKGFKGKILDVEDFCPL